MGGDQLICTVAVLVRRFRFRMAANAPPVCFETPPLPPPLPLLHATYLPPTRLLMLSVLLFSGRDDHWGNHPHHQGAAHGDESKGGCTSGGGTGVGIDHGRGFVEKWVQNKERRVLLGHMNTVVHSRYF